MGRATLNFHTQEDAESFCRKHGWQYEVCTPLVLKRPFFASHCQMLGVLHAVLYKTLTWFWTWHTLMLSGCCMAMV